MRKTGNKIYLALVRDDYDSNLDYIDSMQAFDSVEDLFLLHEQNSWHECTYRKVTKQEVSYWKRNRMLPKKAAAILKRPEIVIETQYVLVSKKRDRS